jgi:tetratricopeptide (TPR) repeat protein
MKKYTLINNLTGWIVFAIATITYLLTIEPTTSLWDCGEYITTANKLEVGHPPGAPLFMMLGRLFSAFVSPDNAAMMVNAMSALSSSFSILFLFWSITMLALKFSEKHSEGALSLGNIIAIQGAGAIGALAYTFTDSFWFSAVEGEVYAMSSLFTAIVFWAILKWERAADEPHANRWIILIAYLIGLSIGVHLLNLLAIPAIAFVYYFKKYEYSHKGFIITGILSIAVLGTIQAIIIPKTIQVAAWFERVFTNSFNLPFNSGSIIFGIVLISLLVFGIRYTMLKNKVVLNTIIASFMVILVGYSTFAMIVIRSNANTPLDENNPETLTSLLSYLNREQYGSWPIAYGPYFNTPQDQQTPYKDGSPSYMKAFVAEVNGKEYSFDTRFNAEQFLLNNNSDVKIQQKYIMIKDGKQSEINDDKNFCTIFPRMFDGREPSKVERYKIWSGYDGSVLTGDQSKPLPGFPIQGMENLNRYEQYTNLMNAGSQEAMNIAEEIEKDGIFLPSFSENLRYFADYQIGWMYWRYFMWNFAGRQNDTQGHGKGGMSMLTEGNWLSGVNFIDSERLGNQTYLTDTIKSNSAYNRYFLLPLLVGLIGFLFHLVKAPKDWFVVMLLFLFTGFAIIIYLNQRPAEPRERDYAYAASFYAFAIWVGMGVLALYHMAKSVTTKDLLKVLGAATATGVLIYLIEAGMDNSHSFSYAIFYLTLLGGAMCLLVHFAGRTKNDVLVASLAFLLCLPAPVLLAMENWDDHDRSDRYLTRDIARAYLDSCAPNAILFTIGDNDTFPLWYVQEVEGYRTDVRVINLSLLSADWHANQAKRKAYDSEPVPFSLPEWSYRQGTRDAVVIEPNKDASKFFNAKDIIQYIKEDKDYGRINHPQVKHKVSANNFYITVNKENCLKYGIVDEKDADKMLDTIRWTVGGQIFQKSDLMVFDLLANFNWERPIYFSGTYGIGANKDLARYMISDGLVNRLTPIEQENNSVDVERTYKYVMETFSWGNMSKPGILVDYHTYREVSHMRSMCNLLAINLIADGDKKRAIEVLDKCLKEIPYTNAPLSDQDFYFALNYFDAGANEKGLEIVKELTRMYVSDLRYLLSFNDKHKMQELYNISDKAEQLANRLPQLLARYDVDDKVLDEMGAELVLQQLRRFADQHINSISTNTNSREIISNLPRSLIREWYPFLFKQ